MRALIASLACLLAGAPLAAAAADCTITATPSFAFTNAYDVFSTTAVAVHSKLTFTCNEPASYRVSIDAGLHGSNVANRAMRLVGGSDLLSYNLYTNASDSTVFGDGTNGSQTVSGSTSGASNRGTMTIYGQLPARQDVGAGSYGDTLTLTISY